MPWTTDYAPDAAEIRFHGETTGNDILDAKRQVFDHAFHEGPRYVLCDFSPVDKFAVSPAAVRRIVEQDRDAARARPGVVEVVVAPTPVEFGSSRMWGFLVDDVHPGTWVAHTRAEVLEWLDDQGIELMPAHQRELAQLRKREA